MSFDRPEGSRVFNKDATTQRKGCGSVFASLRLLIAVAWLAVVPVPAFSEWPTYHGDFGLTGFSDSTLPELPELLWRFNAGGAVYATPVSDGERIFFSAKNGVVIALDLNGSEVWKKSFTRTNDAGQQMPLRFEGPLACTDGLVFAASSRGTLFALNAKCGSEKWRYETDGIFLGSPNLIQCGSENMTVVVLDQSEGALHAVDIATGKRLWKTEGVERCDGSPGVGAGRAVFGSCLSALHLYSTADGTHLRDIEIETDAQVAGGVAVDGNLAYAGARDGSLLCADLEQGRILWVSHESQAQTFSTPALSSNRVVYASDNGFVYALNREDGALLWKFETKGLPTSPVIAKDKVVVSADGSLYLLSLADGKIRWSKEISDEITSPALINGMIIIGADDGTVSAFGETK